MQLTQDLVTAYQGCQFEIALRTYFFEISVFGEISKVTLEDEKLHIAGKVFAKKDASRGKAPEWTRPENPKIDLVIDPKDYPLQATPLGGLQCKSRLSSEVLIIFPVGHINFDPAKIERL